MSDIILSKEDAVKVREALATTSEAHKQAEAKLAEAVKTAKEAGEKVSEAVKTAATGMADRFLAGGWITKEGYDRTVENLVENPMPYLKKAMDLLEAAKKTTAKTASEETSPAKLGKGVPSKYQTEKTSKDRLAEANRNFERAIGL